MTETLLYREAFTGEIRTVTDDQGTPINEITTTDGWTPFWREDDGNIRPEMKVIDASTTDYIEPVMRLNDEGRGLKIFKQWGIIDGGYWKRFVVPAGFDEVHAYLQGHAWYSQVNFPVASLYKAEDGTLHPCDEGMRLWVGIDPAGGIDPWAESVHWQSDCIFDEHRRTGTLRRDHGGIITVFIRTDNDYGFLHVDGYLAAVEVYGFSEDPPATECRGRPRVQYARVVNVYAKGSTDTRIAEITEIARQRGNQTVSGSYDDAGIGDLDDKTAVLWDIHFEDQDEFSIFYYRDYPGTKVVFDGDDGTTEPPVDPPVEPPVEPPTNWTPKRYVTHGILTGFHAAGDGGQTGDVFEPLTPLGAQPPTSKVIVSMGAAKDIKAIDPSVAMIGRIIDAPGWGNVEWFDYDWDADPYWQAVARMNILVEAFGDNLQYCDFIEVINEQDPPTPAHHVSLAWFFMHCMDYADARGFKLALFSHSTGTPEPADWDAIANTGVFEMAANGHAIALHEYNLNSGGGHLYRYRDLYNRIILPKKLDIPLYITEWNIDEEDVENAPLMLANWKAYDAEASKDAFLAGIHIYTTGEIDSRYKTTIYSLWDEYRAWAIANKGRANG